MVRGAVAIGATFAVAASATGAAPRPQHYLLASSHDRSVQATLGSHCEPTDGTMRCADASYPLSTSARLPVHAGGHIVLEFGARPTEVYPELRNRRSAPVRYLRARRAGARRRIVRLPGTLPENMDRLGVFVSYERGSADFEVDLKRHRH